MYFLFSLKVSFEMGFFLRSILMLLFFFVFCRKVDRRFFFIFIEFKVKLLREDISYFSIRFFNCDTCGFNIRDF